MGLAISGMGFYFRDGIRFFEMGWDLRKFSGWDGIFGISKSVKNMLIFQKKILLNEKIDIF